MSEQRFKFVLYAYISCRVSLSNNGSITCHRMLCYSPIPFTASDGSEESTAGRVVSLCSIMMHYRFRSKEVRRA